MRPENKPEGKIGKIIFSRVLSMPMVKYREYIASVCGAPAAVRRYDGGQTGETVFARVKISGRNPVGEIADSCFAGKNELPRRKQRGIKNFKFCHSALDAESRVPGENRDPVFGMVPDFRRDDVWIPAGVYPVLDTGPE
jgi:hypothetical protein